MSNMSYCRFENTARDLDDCYDALEQLMVNGTGKLSRTELAAAKQLVALCGNVVQLIADQSGDDAESVIDDETIAEETLDAANDEAEEEA